MNFLSSNSNLCIKNASFCKAVIMDPKGKWNKMLAFYFKPAQNHQTRISNICGAKWGISGMCNIQEPCFMCISDNELLNFMQKTPCFLHANNIIITERFNNIKTSFLLETCWIQTLNWLWNHLNVIGQESDLIRRSVTDEDRWIFHFINES